MVTETKAESRIQQAIDSASDELERLENKLVLLRWFKRHVEPVVPEGVELSSSVWDYWSKASVDLTIPTVEGREWVVIDGTAALINVTRKAFNIERLNRNVYTYGENVSNSYDGTGWIMVNGERERIGVTIRLGSQLPPTCKIEWEEKEVTRTEKVGKVICD